MRIPITDLATRTKPIPASGNSRARIDSPPFFSLEVNGRLYGCKHFPPESVIAFDMYPHSVRVLGVNFASHHTPSCLPHQISPL